MVVSLSVVRSDEAEHDDGQGREALVTGGAKREKVEVGRKVGWVRESAGGLEKKRRRENNNKNEEDVVVGE